MSSSSIDTGLFRIAALDPGKLRDSAGLVSLVINPPENEIFVEFARRWLRRDYLSVEADIARMYKKAKWLTIYAERNNIGEHVIEVLQQRYSLPVQPVTTAGRITDPEKMKKTKTMSKPEMVTWYLKAKQAHMVKFPQNSKNPDIMELERQISIFAEKITDAGTVTYGAPGQEHDDLVMALLIGCFAARHWLPVGDGAVGGFVGGSIIPDASDYSDITGDVESLLGGAQAFGL